MALKVTAAKMSPDEIAALKGWAAVRGGTPSAEHRLAVKLHLRELAIAHLSHEAGRADVASAGLDPDAELAWLTADLAELRAAAYPATPGPLSRKGPAPGRRREAVA
jgi:hypothetical protein